MALVFSPASLLSPALYRKECGDLLNSPATAIFLIFFLLASGTLPFTVGRFFARNQSDLESLFSLLPWMFMLFLPALTMRSWAEEKRSGTIELLLTLPVSVGQAVLAKTLAAFTVALLAILMTIPLWITVARLGSPDNGAIACAYLGATLLAFSQVSLGVFLSALTKSQTSAFILSLVVIFLFTLVGSTFAAGVLDSFLAPRMQSALLSLSMYTHYQGFTRGTITLGDFTFFVSLSIAAMALGIAAVRRAERVG